MSDIFEILLTAGFWAATVRIVSPLIFGTLGELICERAGVLNLGIEGIMTVGAMAGWMWVYQGGNLWGGVMFAAAMGGMFGLLHAAFTVQMGLSQHVTGIGITLFASSLSYFVYRMLLPAATTPPKIVPFDEVPIPFLSDIPVIGEAVFNQSPLTYLALLTVPVVWYVMYRTPVGLAVRMAGENPVAVEAQGINVLAVRTGAVVVGSALMAIAAVCRPGGPSGPRPADRRRLHPLSVLPDAALCHVDPGDDRHSAQNQIPPGPAGALPARRTGLNGQAHAHRYRPEIPENCL